MLNDIEETINRKITTKCIFTDNVAMGKNIIQNHYQSNFNTKPEVIQVYFTKVNYTNVIY